VSTKPGESQVALLRVYKSGGNPYLFVIVKGGVVLVRRDSGLPEYQVSLGDQHDRFLIDAANRRLFLNSKDRKSLVCYSRMAGS
jgi:hypothetical protein